MSGELAEIPFNRPPLVGKEQDYLGNVLSQRHLEGDGPFTARCSELLAELTSAARVLLTTSCTHALEMAALLLDLRPGDEIIVPSFTFVSTANAFAVHGAKPVFVDVRADTLNLDESLVEAAIGDRTRAIVPVHYGGIACDMRTLTEIAERHGITIIEDNAHGLYGRFANKPLGSFGALATQSFHATKNFVAGEGGALVINDESLIARAEIIREKGTNRSRFFRGEIDKYTWVDLGSSYLPSELVAAVLCAQLENAASIQSSRERIWRRYDRQLRPWAESRGIATPAVPPESVPAYHIYHLLMREPADQQRMIDHLRARGIRATFHYQPLHLSEMGKRFGGSPGSCPVTERVANAIVRLPLYPDLDDIEVERIVAGVTSFS